jgi:hypothetical protein
LVIRTCLIKLSVRRWLISLGLPAVAQRFEVGSLTIRWSTIGAAIYIKGGLLGQTSGRVWSGLMIAGGLHLFPVLPLKINTTNYSPASEWLLFAVGMLPTRLVFRIGRSIGSMLMGSGLISWAEKIVATGLRTSSKLIERTFIVIATGIINCYPHSSSNLPGYYCYFRNILAVHFPYYNNKIIFLRNI